MARRMMRRSGVLVGFALSLVLYAGPPAHADEGLLGDTGPVVEPLVEEVVQPAAEAVTAVPQQPVEQVVAPDQGVVEPVEDATEPVRRATEAVKEAVKDAVQQTAQQDRRPDAQPSVRTVEPTVDHAGGPAAGVAEETGGPTQVTAAREATGTSSSGGVATAESGRGGSSARRASATDLAPRATGAGRLVAYEAGDDPDPQAAEDDLAALTNTLMHLYAGPAVPDGIDAGLAGIAAGAVAGTRTLPWSVPLVLGLLLGLWALLSARRARR